VQALAERDYYPADGLPSGSNRIHEIKHRFDVFYQLTLIPPLPA
jgi:hypothetical protein